MKSITELRKFAESKGKRLVYSRSDGGYQIEKGFDRSEVEYPYRTKSGKLGLFPSQILALKSYI